MPASTLPSAGVLATWASSKPCIRPRMASGVQAKRIVERRIALNSSARPATREHHHADPERRREAEAGDRRAPDDDRGRDRDPLPAHVRRPSPRSSAASERAGRGRRVEDADDARAGVEVVRRDRGEERLRHPEHHRVRVEHEGPEDDRLLARGTASPRAATRAPAGRPRPSAAPARPAAPRRARRRSSPRRSRRSCRTPDGGDQESAERRPGDRAGAGVDRLQRLRGGELLRRDEARHHRAQRRRAERPQRGRRRRQHVQRPDLRMRPENALTASSADDAEQPDLGPEHELAAGRARSAIVPPTAAKSSSGTASQIESSPTWSVECVSW